MYLKKNKDLINLIETLNSTFTNKENFEDFYSNLYNHFSPTLGSTKTEKGENEDGSKWYKVSYTSNDGSYTSTSFFSTNTWDSNTTNKEQTSKEDTTTELSQMKKALKTAVESQNYEDAVKLRDLIKNNEKNSEKVTELKYKLQNAIETQNYEEAIKLRDSIKKFEIK